MLEYSITLFAPTLDEGRLAAVRATLSEFGLRIEDSRWLQQPDTSPALRMHATASAAFEGEFRTALLDAAESVGVDLFLQTTEEARSTPRLFVLDMDSTLIQAEVIDELAALAGVGHLVAGITDRAMRGELDFRQALAERVALLAGLKVSRLSDLHHRIQFSPGADVLVRGLRAAGCVTVVVSGGFGFFAREAQKQLGFDYLFCNELETANQKLTGRVDGPIVDAQRKRTALIEVAEREHIPAQQVVAVGDGANDIPMLNEAAVGVAYRAKPIVKAAARYRLTHSQLDSLLHLLQ